LKYSLSDLLNGMFQSLKELHEDEKRVPFNSFDAFMDLYSDPAFHKMKENEKYTRLCYGCSKINVDEKYPKCRCKLVSFCTAECFKAAWDHHKKECPSMDKRGLNADNRSAAGRAGGGAAGRVAGGAAGRVAGGAAGRAAGGAAGGAAGMAAGGDNEAVRDIEADVRHINLE